MLRSLQTSVILAASQIRCLHVDPLIQHLVTVFMAFLAMMNPLSSTVIFMSVTEGKSARERKQISIRANAIAFFLIVLFVVLGKSIFHVFDITLPALHIAGGIIVFIMGYNMLTESSSTNKQNINDTAGDVAVSPLAVPEIAGPGCISIAMSNAVHGGWTESGITIAVFFVLCLVTHICFMSNVIIQRVLGESGLGIVTRLMGLISAVVGVQMIIIGINVIK